MSTALKIFCQKSWAWGRATRMINYIHIESISNFMTKVRATKWGKITFKGELLFLGSYYFSTILAYHLTFKIKISTPNICRFNLLEAKTEAKWLPTSKQMVFLVRRLINYTTTSLASRTSIGLNFLITSISCETAKACQLWFYLILFWPHCANTRESTVVLS